MSTITIKGIELDEIEELDYNRIKLRNELEDKLSYKNSYDKVVQSISKSNRRGDTGIVFKILLFIVLFPFYLNYQFGGRKRSSIVREAEEELVNHYQLPQVKVKRFRLQCTHEKYWYEGELKIIDNEIDKLDQNLESSSIGDKTRIEIRELLVKYRASRDKKFGKFTFYKNCEERLLKIEEEFAVRKSISKSKNRLVVLSEGEAGESRKADIEREFEIYDYYGKILNELSTNLQRVENDKEEEMDELELKEVLLQIEKIKVGRN